MLGQIGNPRTIEQLVTSLQDVHWAMCASHGAQAMNRRSVIVLTGGPGGGKSTLLDELQRRPNSIGRFIALPEVIFMMHRVGISPREKLFQRLIVHLQMALEDGVNRALGLDDLRPILCHRGSLDPLAYWIDLGWSEEAFFTYTDTTLEEHYQRYAAVIHLVTAADGAEEHYARWPVAHRTEQIEDAIRLDGLLHRVWRDHPNYHSIDNVGQTWEGKEEKARRILSTLVLLS